MPTQRVRTDSEFPPGDFRSQWSLRPDVVYLNHGSFGPSPRSVIEARRQWIDRLESDPVDFLMREAEPALAEARNRLGRFIGTSGENLIFVDNATMGMNIVAASVTLGPDDEVLLTDHEYGAVTRLWEKKCRQAGAKLVSCRLPLPITGADAVVDAVFTAATPRTRLLVISHITSPTAIVLPVEAICRRAKQEGIPVCIDGPHALVQVPVDLDRLDCDFYTASCHKWLSAPFGTGFLFVHPRRQDSMQPLVVSWGQTPGAEKQSWRDEFNWAGTRDPAAFLSVTAAIEFIEGVGLDVFRQRTHALASYARTMITEQTGLPALIPDNPAWYGSMISLPLPAGEVQPLQNSLWQQHRIEIPVFEWQRQRLIRVSCHLYTRPDEIELLCMVLPSFLR